MPLTNAEWRKLKKDAPKVPDITCPAIDDVIKRLDKMIETNKVLTEYQHGVLCRRLEKLRTATNCFAIVVCIGIIFLKIT